MADCIDCDFGSGKTGSVAFNDQQLSPFELGIPAADQPQATFTGVWRRLPKGT
ncbi:hypothetical protein [Planctopirus limnophila]|uniref:hypothetical protein n=1 Tax=Planctopirus limnophila TaxID=120 RepID=UPI0002D3A82B|nr:hypothetical protein [Planctopirus limnophila]